MNAPDFLGIAFLVLGVLLLIPTVYVSWVFVVGVGFFASLGLFLIIEMGELFRHPLDVPAEMRSDEKREAALDRLPALNVRPTERV